MGAGEGGQGQILYSFLSRKKASNQKYSNLFIQISDLINLYSSLTLFYNY